MRDELAPKQNLDSLATYQPRSSAQNPLLKKRMSLGGSARMRRRDMNAPVSTGRLEEESRTAQQGAWKKGSNISWPSTVEEVVKPLVWFCGQNAREFVLEYVWSIM